MSASNVFIICFISLVFFVFNGGLHPVSVASKVVSKSSTQQIQDEKPVAASTIPSYSNRKLMTNGICTNRDISISQTRDLSSGIPQYIVQIVNTCMSGCPPSDIHLHCGWFASAEIVNPNTFKRVSYDDCVVNEGRSLRRSQIIRFTYSNSFMYPLVFKSARFC